MNVRLRLIFDQFFECLGSWAGSQGLPAGIFADVMVFSANNVWGDHLSVFSGHMLGPFQEYQVGYLDQFQVAKTKH